MEVLEKKILLFIIAAGLLLRIATVAVLNFTPDSDYAAYQAMAVNFLAGKGIVDTFGNLAMYNVGYPLFILTPAFALSENNLLVAQLANALLGAISIGLCYSVAREAGANRTGRLLAATFFALYLPSWIYAEYLAKENLMIPIMLGVIWCALRIIKNASFGVAAICGTLFGLIALTGNSALSIVVAVLFALFFSQQKLGRKIYMLAIIGVTMFCVAAPWAIRNYQVLGAPVLNTNGGFNLYLGNNPAATGYFVSIADTPRGPDWQALRKTGEVQASETLGRDAISWIKENPSQFFVLSLKKAALFWTPPIHEGKGESSKMEIVTRLLWLIQFCVLAIGAIGVIFFTGLRTRQVGILFLAVVGYTAAHMLFYVIFRYREPIMPLLCVLAALSYERLWDKVKQYKIKA